MLFVKDPGSKPDDCMTLLHFRSEKQYAVACNKNALGGTSDAGTHHLELAG